VFIGSGSDGAIEGDLDATRRNAEAEIVRAPAPGAPPGASDGLLGVEGDAAGPVNAPEPWRFNCGMLLFWRMGIMADGSLGEENEAEAAGEEGGGDAYVGADEGGGGGAANPSPAFVYAKLGEAGVELMIDESGGGPAGGAYTIE